MSKIRILPEDVSNRIAAGEVIERPASVVKELAENALDADATQISVTVSRGGRSLIQVVDDGHGMDREDALLCLEAHATSKVHSSEDIQCIETLGFRGEAVPSIASVSQFTLQTRERDAEHGVAVRVDGGTIADVAPAGCAPGTSVTVRNLFYNLPARRKFLRAIATEEGHIEDVLMLLALANPQCGFDLRFGSRNVFSVRPSGDLRTRAAMLLGRETLAEMLPVAREAPGLQVSGFAARPGLTRSSRREQRAFVNGRPVASDAVYHAVRTAYHTLVVKGRYPPVLLFLELDPRAVDVNVHPAKREVRFHDRRAVAELITAALEDALRQQVTGVLSGHSQRPLPRGASPVPQPLPPPVRVPERQTSASRAVAVPGAGDVPLPVAAAEAGGPPVSGPPEAPMRLLGVVADLYLVAEGSRGLVLIDRRAAHERVLFERLVRQAREGGRLAQGLLLPVTLDLAAADAAVLERHLDRLRELGFELERFGGNTFVLAAIPSLFPQEDVVGLVHDLIDGLRDGLGPTRQPALDGLAQAACRAAAQRRQPLAPAEVEGLLAELLATELPYVCPRGRPTMINIAYSELERRFGARSG